jgi:alkylation response protein AidB-like acyl-CoA dehydrogenase
MAAMRLDEEYGVQARKAVSGLKVQVAKGGTFVGQNAVQLHGGMGMTDELSIGFFVKRLMIINSLFGDADYHQQLFAALVNTPASSAAA